MNIVCLKSIKNTSFYKDNQITSPKTIVKQHFLRIKNYFRSLAEKNTHASLQGMRIPNI